MNNLVVVCQFWLLRNIERSVESIEHRGKRENMHRYHGVGNNMFEERRGKEV